VYFYATPAELAAMDAMKDRFGPIPLSRSLLIRTAIATLQRILATGYVFPPVEDKLMAVERDDAAELPTQLALAIDFAKIAHADVAA
jgi:hypothetical protein